MPFFDKTFSATIAPGSSSSNRYLNPSDLDDGASVRFHILSDEPLTGYEVWFQKHEGGMTKRLTPEAPDAELLDELEVSLNATVAERDGKKAIKAAAAFFVWNYDQDCVQVFSATQKMLLGELDALTSDPDYEDLSAWDLKLSRTGKGTDTRYKLLAVPTKRQGATAKAINAAWAQAQSAGADLTALFSGGDPLPRPTAAAAAA